MKKIGQMIKKYGNTVLLFLAVFSASEIGISRRYRKN